MLQLAPYPIRFMRLGIVSPFPPEISGVGQYGWYVSRGLAASGRFERIVVWANQADHARDAVGAGPLTLRRVWRRDDPRAAYHLLRAIAADRPDALWFNAGLTIFGRSRLVNFLGLLVPLLARRMGLPVVVTLHEIFRAARLPDLGLQDGRLTHWGVHLTTRLLLEADAVCVTLRRYANLLQAHYGRRNIHHLPHGSFTPITHLLPPADAPPSETLFFSSLAPHRGVAVLMNAFRDVQRRLPQATLAIAGADHPRFPGYTAQLRASINGQRGLRWMGVQSEASLLKLFARARIVALPYLATSGASSVMARAAAAGRPIVASDLPDLRAMAEEANLLVDFTPRGDAPALAQTLTALLENPERQAEMARHNLRAMRTMTLDSTCERYADLLTHVAKQEHGRL